MTNEDQDPQPSWIDLEFILTVLFRHKWKIIICSLAGLAAAAFLYFTGKPMYQSRAKLLVRYVTDTRSLAPREQVRSPDTRGENIINSELEILTSSDLALLVADAVGPDKILGKNSGGIGRNRAAGVVLKNLQGDVPGKSDVITLMFAHPDPEVAQGVLRTLIERYLEKHVQIHSAIGAYDFLTQQTDQLRSRLMETEAELEKLKRQAGVVSLKDTKAAVNTELGRLRRDLLESEVGLVEGQARMKEIEKVYGPGLGAVTSAAGEAKPDTQELAKYNRLSRQLLGLQMKEADLTAQYTEDHPLLKSVRSQMETTEKLKKELEVKNPLLTTMFATSTSSRNPLFDPLTETAQLAGLEAKTKVLKAQLDKVRTEAEGIDQVEKAIVQLERKKELEEANYRYFSANLEQARIDTALDSGKVSNISIVQAASAPSINFDGLIKSAMTALGGGVALGLLLAFLLETFFARTLNRASDISSKVRIPLFLTIPDIGAPKERSRVHFRRLFRRLPQPANPPTPEKLQPLALEPNSMLKPYCEALRDRIIMHFDQKKMIHSPKLVGVTGCGVGAGVTTVATGLAAAMSESGAGKVLLVDLGLPYGAAHPFFQGKPARGLLDILDNGYGASSQVSEKLYLASASGSNGSPVPVRSKQFTDLMPRLRASDYDYILFDLPPVNATSVSFRLAAFMDITLLLMESEKTHRNVAQRASSLLAQSGANLAGVLNKSKDYLPKWLQQEL